MLSLSLFVALALAEEPTEAVEPAGVVYDLSVGFTAVINDPNLNRRGLQLGGAVDPTERFGLGVMVSALPSLGAGDWTVSLRQREQEDSDSRIHLTRMVGRAVASVRYWPVVLEQDGQVARLGLEVAGGAVYTVDDDAHNGYSTSSITRQVHPYAHAGVSAEYRTARAGARLSLSQGVYREEYRLERVLRHKEARVPLSVSVDLLIIPSGWLRSRPER